MVRITLCLYTCYDIPTVTGMGKYAPSVVCVGGNNFNPSMDKISQAQ